MKRNTLTLVIFSLLIIFSSCSLGDTKTKLVKENIETRINQDSQGAIKLLSFQKTDGQERVESEAHSYLLNFTAVIEYQKDCYKNGGGMTGWRYADFTVSLNQPEGWNSYWESTGYHYRKGTKVTLTGQGELEKPESGWTIRTVNITDAQATK